MRGILVMANLYASGSTWNTASNWGTTTGASDGTIPTSADAVIFDANSIDMALDVAGEANSINTTGYTGNFSQEGYALTTVAGFTAAAGAFVGSAGTLTIGGPLLISGATFTAPSGILSLADDFDITSGTFLHNNGTIRYVGVGGIVSITQNENTFYDFKINKTGSPVFTVTGALVVENDFTIEESGATLVTINGTRPLAVDGDVFMGTVPYAGTIDLLMRETANFTPSPTWTNIGTVIFSDDTYSLDGIFAIIREDGFNILREDGFRILREVT